VQDLANTLWVRFRLVVGINKLAAPLFAYSSWDDCRSLGLKFSFGLDLMLRRWTFVGARHPISYSEITTRKYLASDNRHRQVLLHAC
jgi:hypothetical protein